MGCRAAGRLSAKRTRRPRLTLPRPAVLRARCSIKISQIPAWLRWAQWLCSLKFTLNLVMGTEFAECAQQDTQIGADCAFLLEANEVNLDAQWRDAVRAPRPRAARCCLAPREMSGLRGEGSARAAAHLLACRCPSDSQGVLIALFFGFQLLAYLALTQKANGNVY